MPVSNHPPLVQISDVISDIASHIHDYTKSPTDFTRNRKLNTESTLRTILNMQGQSINAELLAAFPDMDERMTASAFDQAKNKLKPQVFIDMFNSFNATPHKHEKLTVQTAYSVYAIDGCDFNIPYSPDSEFIVDYNAGRPKKDGSETKAFCMIYANLLYGMINREYVDCVLQKRTEMDERDAAIEMIKRLDNSSPFIVIVDRGYTGFNFIETLNRIPNCHYIVRTKATAGAISEIRDLPDDNIDKDMTFKVTTSGQYYRQHKNENLHHITHINKHYKKDISKNTKDARWDFEQFCDIKCRVCKFRIKDEGDDQWEVLLTNLNRFEFPLTEMKKMYHLRWGIETSFMELKYDLSGISFHSKKADFIIMELYAHFIMFNVVSRYINQTTVCTNKNRKHNYEIDFKMACLIVRKYFREKLDYRDVYKELIMYVHPIRPDRKDKRKAVRPKTAICFVYRVA